MEQVNNWQVSIKQDGTVHVKNHKGVECNMKVRTLAGRSYISSNDNTYVEVPKYVLDYIKASQKRK